MISPLNSFVGLTRQAPGVAPELEALLYPTGRRNYLPASFRPTIYKARRSHCSPATAAGTQSSSSTTAIPATAS